MGQSALFLGGAELNGPTRYPDSPLLGQVQEVLGHGYQS